MNIWILTVFILLLKNSYAMDSRYECGAHGRFEYCIDDIPGCVIGCHCHPGYYFDTDSKICEPNTKLTQDNRRHYNSAIEPTRIPTEMIIYSTVTQSPTPTTANSAKDKIDNIDKDDDLSDWLYSQFFKTIENQVINNTNKEELLTRRSARGFVSKANKKKRKIPKKKNKHKNKNDDIRRKLLRITENDSLFDSTSSETDSSSSFSSSSETDSSSSHHTSKESDKEHQYKKIIMINKKPKPPLPSFIFLPNVETPFYPPIGLPPPPIVPMYPLVPVPPVVAPPSFSYPEITKHKDEHTEITSHVTSQTTESQRETTDAKSSSVTILPITTTSITASTTTTTSDSATTSPPSTSTKKSKYSTAVDNAAMVESDGEERSVDPEQESTTKKTAKIRNFNSIRTRNKILQKLREHRKKIKNLKKINQKMSQIDNANTNLPINHFIDQVEDFQSPYFDDIILQEPVKQNEIQANPDENLENDVDFKYLTELIHRVNPNTKDLPLIKIQPNNNTIEIREPQKQLTKRVKNFKISGAAMLPSRRFIRRRHLPKANEPDNYYYAHLGRQIASLIRNIDSKATRQVNIEIEKSNPITAVQPILNANSYSQGNYWERAVRSPLSCFNHSEDKFDYLRKNHDALFDIENKVKIAATTEPILNLQEIENIVRVMQNAKFIMDNEENEAVGSSSTQNSVINLLPSSQYSNENIMNNSWKNMKKIIERKIFPKNAKVLNGKNTKEKLLSQYIYNDTNQDLIHNKNSKQIVSFSKGYSHNKILSQNMVKDKKLQPSHKMTMKQPHADYRLDYNNMNYNYFSNNNNKPYLQDQLLLPHQISTVSKTKSFLKPIFHREFQYFDYFD